LNAGRLSGIIILMQSDVWIYNFIFFILALILVSVFIPVVKKLSLNKGFVDKPGGRKKHEGEVPPIGGIIIFPVFIFLSLISGLVTSHYLFFYLALILLLLVGALDDLKTVRPRIKFAAHFVSAFIIVLLGGAELSQLGNVFGLGDFWLGFMAAPFSIIAVVLLINAINLMDGLDGLAGGKGFIALFWLFLCCLSIDPDSLKAIVILSGALFGFLIYNFRHPFREKASVFLGDAGSLALGLSLGWFSIYLGRGDDPAISPMTVAWILAIPIFDICGQFARRVREGRHPFDADNDHFHHHFVKIGLSVRRSTQLILLICFCFGGLGYLAHELEIPEYFMAYSWIALLLAHIYLSLNPNRYRAFISKLVKGNE
jgi:UDP-GlcNAc:undecaprenyl-phosphate GlcNAc-1-phosphate transferase